MAGSAPEMRPSPVFPSAHPAFAALDLETNDRTVRKNVTIDRTTREDVRAQLRVLVKRVLRKYGYPPDKQEKATETMLEQAEVIAGEWVG
jgi:type I restriction enzyme R subunit